LEGFADFAEQNPQSHAAGGAKAPQSPVFCGQGPQRMRHESSKKVNAETLLNCPIPFDIFTFLGYS
jgi:hypothetical protein